MNSGEKNPQQELDRKKNIPSEYELFCSADEIASCVELLGAEITNWFREVAENSSTEIVVMPIMKGALFFVADLLRQINVPLKIYPFWVKAYDEQTDTPLETGVEIVSSKFDLTGKCVLVVDDICDSGKTLKKVTDFLRDCGAEEVRSAVLIKREISDEVLTQPNYVAISYTGDEWFVGYGMDHGDLMRSLPDLYIIKPSN